MSKANPVPMPVPDPAMLARSVSDVVTAMTEWQKVAEQEKTNRAVIQAQRDVWLEKIRADREIMLDYLNRSFEQQGKALDALFQRLDTALEGGDPAIIVPILGGIVETVKASPLGDLATLDRRLADNSFTFSLGRPTQKPALPKADS